MAQRMKPPAYAFKLSKRFSGNTVKSWRNGCASVPLCRMGCSSCESRSGAGCAMRPDRCARRPRLPVAPWRCAGAVVAAETIGPSRRAKSRHESHDQQRLIAQSGNGHPQAAEADCGKTLGHDESYGPSCSLDVVACFTASFVVNFVCPIPDRLFRNVVLRIALGKRIRPALAYKVHLTTATDGVFRSGRRDLHGRSAAIERARRQSGPIGAYR
jgi:hypothetical protein